MSSRQTTLITSRSEVDADRWRQIATLMRKIDEEKRGVSPTGMDDDELLDLALTALRAFPKLVAERDEGRRVMTHLRRRGRVEDPITAINIMALESAQYRLLLDVFECVNRVAGPNLWLKRWREAIEQMEQGDGLSLIRLRDAARAAWGTNEDLNGAVDTATTDEAGEADERQDERDGD